MLDSKNSFAELEKQVEKDELKQSLELTLKTFQETMRKENDKSRNALSDEVRVLFKGLIDTLEKRVSKEIEQKMGDVLEKNLSDLNKKVQMRFEERIEPVFKRTEEEMRNINAQGEKTIHSWDMLVAKYTWPWRVPFLVLLLGCVLTGTLICIIVLLLKTSTLSFFLLNQRNREAYTIGNDYLNSREERSQALQQQAQSPEIPEKPLGEKKKNPETEKKTQAKKTKKK